MVRRSDPSVADQRQSALSSPAVAIQRPSGLKAIQSIGRLCQTRGKIRGRAMKYQMLNPTRPATSASPPQASAALRDEAAGERNNRRSVTMPDGLPTDSCTEGVDSGSSRSVDGAELSDFSCAAVLLVPRGGC